MTAPRMVTNWCRRAEGDPAAPCTCGRCDRPATDPAAEPDSRGERSLVFWVPVVFAVAALRWVRWRVSGWLYAAADAVNPAPPLSEDAQATMAGRIMRAVDAEAARDRGGAT